LQKLHDGFRHCYTSANIAQKMQMPGYRFKHLTAILKAGLKLKTQCTTAKSAATKLHWERKKEVAISHG
jgi:hypothetical protein